MLRWLFPDLFNRCAVCGKSYEPEMLQDVGKYYMCLDCLEQEKKERKKKNKDKVKRKKKKNALLNS